MKCDLISRKTGDTAAKTRWMGMAEPRFRVHAAELSLLAFSTVKGAVLPNIHRQSTS